MLSRYRSSCRSVYNCFACILFTRRCISSSEIVPFSRTRACSSLLFIISRSSSFCRYSVSTEASSSLRRGSPSSTESPGFLYTSRIRVLIGVTMISSCSGISLPDALTLISIGPRSTFRMKSSFSCRSFPSTRDRMSSAAVAAVPVTASRSSRFSIFCFFTSAGISRSIFCLLYGV